jgi:hypothetical protein
MHEKGPNGPWITVPELAALCNMTVAGVRKVWPVADLPPTAWRAGPTGGRGRPARQLNFPALLAARLQRADVDGAALRRQRERVRIARDELEIAQRRLALRRLQRKLIHTDDLPVMLSAIEAALRYVADGLAKYPESGTVIDEAVERVRRAMVMRPDDDDDSAPDDSE